MPTHNPHLITQHTISCCRDCVAPKRHTACGGHCPDYQKQRAEYDAQKATTEKKREMAAYTYLHRADKIAKSHRKHGR